MGDILEKGDEIMANDDWYVLDDKILNAIIDVRITSRKQRKNWRNSYEKKIAK